MEHFKVGDHVTWNSDLGHITGHITQVHHKDVTFLGKTRKASPEEPQYQVKSEKTGALAMHKPGALKHVSR